MEEKLHPTKNSLPQDTRTEVNKILNKTLAATADLYAQLKQAHWNIKGREFIAVHKLLDEIAEDILEQVDIVAERITSLGGTAYGTIQNAVDNTPFKPYPTNIFSIIDHIEHLTTNIALLGKLTRGHIKETEKLQDMATNDIYIDLVRILDKYLWFLEAHLQA